MQPHELKSLRKEMNLRQAGLAKALGLSAAFIGMMERGEKPIEPRTALSVRYLIDHPEERPDVEVEDVRSYGAAEAFDAFRDSRKLVDGRTWGRWRFNAESLSLDLDSEEVVMERDDDGNDVIERTERYYVMLCDLTEPRFVLDWIGQIAGKGWGAVTVGHFVEALDTILGLQSRFAHGTGFKNGDDLRAYLRERVDRDALGDEA